MADNSESTAKTKGLGKISITKLQKVKQWKEFEAKSKVAAEANAAHEQAKAAMRDFLKQTLGLAENVNLDFSRDKDGTINVIERLQVKEKRTKGANLLDDLIR